MRRANRKAKPVPGPHPPRVWGLSFPVWWLVAGFCLFCEVAADFAENGRINGWGDVVFVITLAAVGVIAFLNGLRAALRLRPV